MDEARLDRYLKMIGKRTFVEYYELFTDFNLPDQLIAETIATDLGYTYDNAMSWRVKPARTVIRAGQGRNALTIISGSNRLSPDVTQKASELAGRAIGQ